MINTEHTANGVVSGGTPTPTHDKQLPIKKTALRDVQNENMGIQKQPENLLPGGGKSSSDTIKVCGTKRLTPERPSSSQGMTPLAYSGMNENVMNARRRFELELGRGRLQNNVDKISDYSELKNLVPLKQEIAQKITQTRDSSNLTATKALMSSGPSSVPSSFGKQSNSTTAAAKVSPEVPRGVDLKSSGDQLRTERFIRLQKFLKQCDEANQREYTQMLLRLSPSELSKHAVDLEKRAIQLTIEEGSEMQRMKTLNILAKSSPMNNLTKSTQLLQSNKR